MAVRRGKRRKRERRQRDPQSPQVEPQPSEPPSSRQSRPRRQRKPLAERSPFVPAFFALLCLLGAVFTAVNYGLGTKSYGNLAFAGLYVVLAGIEGYVAYRVYRARQAARPKVDNTFTRTDS